MHITFYEIKEGKPTAVAEHTPNLGTPLGDFIAERGWPDTIILADGYVFTCEDYIGKREASYNRTSAFKLEGVLSPEGTKL